MDQTQVATAINSLADGLFDAAAKWHTDEYGPPILQVVQSLCRDIRQPIVWLQSHNMGSLANDVSAMVYPPLHQLRILHQRAYRFLGGDAPTKPGAAPPAPLVIAVCPIRMAMKLAHRESNRMVADSVFNESDTIRRAFQDSAAYLRGVAEVIQVTTSEGDEKRPVDGLTWQEAAERLKRLRDQGEAYTSQGTLGKQLGCSPSTINKAIQNTPDLRDGWARRRTATPRAQSLNDVVTDRTAQSQEVDPLDAAAIREYIEAADPNTKAWFLALSPADQIDVVNDPDQHPRIFGRKP